MTYRARTLLKAAVGLVLLAALVLFATFGIHPGATGSSGDNRLDQRVFPGLSESEVVRVEVEHGTWRTVAVRVGGKDGSLWKLQEPVTDEADPIAVGALLETMAGIRVRRRLAGDGAGPAEDYGLDKPRGKVALVDGDDQRFVLLVGKHSDFDNSLYVQRHGQQDVLVVAGQLRQALLKRPFDLRRKVLVRFNRDRADRIGLVRGAASIMLEKRTGVWHLRDPIEDMADREEVEKLLNVLHAMRARAYPPPDKLSLASYGLDPPDIVISVAAGASGPARKVALGRGESEMLRNRCYARRIPAGPIAEIRSHQLHAFEKDRFDLQAKAPVRFEQHLVHRIKSSGRGHLMVLERDTDLQRWSLVAPRAVPAKRHAVDSMLHALAGLRALRFAEDRGAADLVKYGLQPPARTLTLFDREGDEIGWLSIGNSTSEGTWVVGSHRPKICQVDSRKLDRIPLNPAELAQENP